MNISQALSNTYRELRDTVEKSFNVKVNATRGFFEDERNNDFIGLSFQPFIASITSHGGHARVLNNVTLTTYVTIDRKDRGQLKRLELASNIFAHFGGKSRYNNFIILDCKDFNLDFEYQGLGDVYKFTMILNIDLLKGGNNGN